MKSKTRLPSHPSVFSSDNAAKRAKVELLEARQLLSATADIPNLSAEQGLLLPEGDRLLISFNDLVAIGPDGKFDTSFGTNGRATVAGMVLGAGPTNVFVNPIAVDDSGHILVAGSVAGGGGAVARFLPDGTIDTSFGNGGVATMQLGSGSLGFFALAVEPDGTIVAVGESSAPGAGGQFAIGRFNDDGSPDLDFNGSGLVCIGLSAQTGSGTVDLADTVTFDADGSILVGGTCDFSNEPIKSTSALGMVRINDDGTLDQTFGTGGQVITYFGNSASGSAASLDPVQMASLLVQDDGTILAVGEGQSRQIMAAVYNDDGTLDSAYGIGGRVMIVATSGSAEHVSLNDDGGFDVMRINDETVWATVDSTGQWLEGPATPKDPTPPDAYNQTPSEDPSAYDPGVLIPVSVSYPVATGPWLTDPSLTDPGATVPTIAILDPVWISGTSSIINAPLGHVELHRPKLPRAVVGKLFSGRIATVSGISNALSQAQATVDWGDGSAVEQASLTAVAKHPARTAVNADHQYTKAGVYSVRVTLTVEDVTRTITRTLHVKTHTPNGRALQAPAGQTITPVIGHVSADALAPSGDSTAVVLLDWGDGTTASMGVARKHGDGYDIVGTHTYQTHGQYHVIAKRGNALASDFISIESSAIVVFVSLVNVL